MFPKAFVIHAKVLANGRITIPRAVCDVLGVSSGDQVTFIVEGNAVRMVNSAVYSMQTFQRERKLRNECFD